MHKRRAAQESLKAPPLLGWRRFIDLCGLYIGTVLPTKYPETQTFEIVSSASAPG